MWKERRLAGHSEVSTSEASIESRDKSIRELIDELVSGTLELKSLYSTGDANDPNRKQ